MGLNPVRFASFQLDPDSCRVDRVRISSFGSQELDSISYGELSFVRVCMIEPVKKQKLSQLLSHSWQIGCVTDPRFDYHHQ